MSKIKKEIEISLGVSKVNTNQDQDFLICQDELLKPVKIFSTVETKLFFSWSRFIKSRLFCWEFEASRFLLRLSRHIQIVNICRDAAFFCRDLLRSSKICREILTFLRLFEVRQAQKSWQIEKSLLKNMIKLTKSQSRSRQTVEKCQNFQIWTNFSIKTFWSGHWCHDEIEKSLSRPRFLNCRDALFDYVEIETNRDPRLR
jgi:hypothetical protein